MPEHINPTDPTELLIVDVLERCDVSVRLSNAITTANSNGGLPYQTVGEYLQAGPEAKLKFLSIPHLGRGSADELDQIIRGFVRDFLGNYPNGFTAKADEAIRVEAVREALIAWFDGLRFPEILLESNCTTRLRNVLETNSLGLHTFSEFLRDYSVFHGQLVRLPNLGRKSVSELYALCEGLTGRLLYSWGLSDEQVKAAHELVYERAPPNPTMLQALDDAMRNVNLLPDRYAALKPADETLLKVVEEQLAAVQQRDKCVVERRYGFSTGQIETLEGIAQDFGVTRERIRQVEAKFHRRLRLPGTARRLRQTFDREIDDVLNEVLRGAQYIRENEETEILCRLPGHVRLAIDVLYEEPRSFLDSRGTRWGGGWILSSLSKADLDEALKEIGEWHLACRLLSPISWLTGTCHPRPCLPRLTLERVSSCSTVTFSATGRLHGAAGRSDYINVFSPRERLSTLAICS
jgi:RNA polymerase primary sigma factor